MSARIARLAERLACRTPSAIESLERDQAAVAVVLAPHAESSDIELLLIERAERDGDPWSGHMALPGGRRDHRDRDLAATAVREVREETGVELAPAALLGRLDDLRPIRWPERRLSVRPFVYWSAERPEVTLGEEVAGALWVPLGALPRLATETDVRHRGADLRVPAFVVEGRVVWGMTQRVLAGLLELDG